MAALAISCKYTADTVRKFQYCFELLSDDVALNAAPDGLHLLLPSSESAYPLKSSSEPLFSTEFPWVPLQPQLTALVQEVAISCPYPGYRIL